jgi:hypothetical protein
MLMTIVLLIFALHVVAWLTLPAGYPRRESHVPAAHAGVGRVATAMPMADSMEG